ncbi:LysR family transcriptional regulator [Denitrobaculum tricleocarpae]|nr:LysR family transcriptional regulator [Denitrobaculum tricleocarpae]
MIKIEWRHYRILLAIQESGSLTAAGKAVGLTQSAASHQVKEAERRLGANLVLRRGRSLRLTEAGKALADAAAACAPLLLEAETKAREVSLRVWQRLRIAFGPQDGLNWVPDVGDYLRTNPDPMQLDLIAAGPGQATDCLRRDEADLALEVGQVAFAGLKRSHICDDELLCIFAQDSALCPALDPTLADEPVTAQEIANQTYFAHSLVPQAGFELETFFRPAADRPAHIAQVQSIPAIVALVAAGQGVSIQPRSAVAAAIERNEITGRSLAPTPVRQPWFLYARPEVIAQHGEPLFAGVAEAIAPHLAASHHARP